MEGDVYIEVCVVCRATAMAVGSDPALIGGNKALPAHMVSQNYIVVIPVIRVDCHSTPQSPE